MLQPMVVGSWCFELFLLTITCMNHIRGPRTNLEMVSTFQASIKLDKEELSGSLVVVCADARWTFGEHWRREPMGSHAYVLVLVPFEQARS